MRRSLQLFVVGIESQAYGGLEPCRHQSGAGLTRAHYRVGIKIATMGVTIQVLA